MPNANYSMLVRNAATLIRQRKFRDAQDICHQLLKQNKRSPEALRMLADTNWYLGHYVESNQHLQKYVRLYPDDLSARALYAKRLRHVGRIKDAIAQYDRIIRKKPDDPAAIAGLARCYVAKGDNEKAAARLQKYVDAGTEDTQIARTFVIAKVNSRDYEPAIDVAQRHINDDTPDAEALGELRQALGQACEKTGKPEQAFAAFEAANCIARPNYNPADLNNIVKKQMRLFTRESLQKLPRATIDTTLPIFVVGMPRCGSTLVERIIAAHPEAHTAGEFAGLSRIVLNLPLTIGSDAALPEAILDIEADDADSLAKRYLEELRAVGPKAKRIVDKYLGNCHYLSLIELLFPQARVIDMRRDAVDNCFACYTALLGQPHPYSYTLAGCAWEYRGTERLMQHWHEVLNIPMLRVDYEQLVQDQETQTRRIIEFCGLPWDDACLRFHEIEKTTRSGAAPTLSYAQVRRPMYTSSVNRAGQYGALLDPLREALDEAQRYWSEQPAM